MTKAQEMVLFDEFAAKFPRDSYLGPWLRGIREQVASDIRNDFSPMAKMPAEAYREAKLILADAKNDAAERKQAMDEHVAKRVKDANDAYAAIRLRCIGFLNKAIAEL
jgi:hypothetical protein